MVPVGARRHHRQRRRRARSRRLFGARPPAGNDYGNPNAQYAILINDHPDRSSGMQSANYQIPGNTFYAPAWLYAILLASDN